MNSASAVDRASVGCRWERQEIAAPFSINTNPKVDRRQSGQPALSESTKLHRDSVLGGMSGIPRIETKDQYMRPKLLVFLMYRKTRFAASRCGLPGLETKRERSETAHEMSGRVHEAK
jgi:hypothetical protein